MGGEGGRLAICYIISGGLVKLLYNVIWGRGVLTNWHFLLYNMWTAPKDAVVLVACHVNHMC